MLVFSVVVLLCLIILAALYYIPGYTSPVKNSHGAASIASLEKINLGRAEQWILIRGTNISNPVILFLHGGPGASDMCLLRRHMSELEKHFVVVSWDQRGAGKSYAAINPESSMTINQFISDVHELTQLLRHRFNQKKIFLVGHSWGTVLGILTVQKYPDLYHSYIGIGQLANMQENERISYYWTLEQAKNVNDKRAVKKLTEIGEPPYTGKWQKKFMTERRLLGKFGGEFYGNSKGAFPIVVGSLLRATEFNLRDKVNFFRGIFASVRLLWPKLMTVNLMEQAPCLEVPVYFVLGKHDYEAPFILAEKYFKILEAPSKELIWFENSAHLPNIEENEKFTDLLINHVLIADNVQEHVIA